MSAEETNLERLLRYCRNDGAIAEHLDIPVDTVRAAREKLGRCRKRIRGQGRPKSHDGLGPQALGDNEFQRRRMEAELANAAYLRRVRAAHG